VVYGLKDEYLDYIKPDEYKNFFDTAGFHYNIVNFDGKHEMNAEVLKKVGSGQ